MADIPSTDVGNALIVGAAPSCMQEATLSSEVADTSRTSNRSGWLATGRIRLARIGLRERPYD